MNERVIIKSNFNNFLNTYQVNYKSHHGQMIIRKWNKWRSIWAKDLDIDHLNFYKMNDNKNVIYLSSTYDNSEKMNNLYNRNGWIMITPVYNTSCNSFILIKDRYINNNF